MKKIIVEIEFKNGEKDKFHIERREYRALKRYKRKNIMAILEDINNAILFVPEQVASIREV